MSPCIRSQWHHSLTTHCHKLSTWNWNPTGKCRYENQNSVFALSAWLLPSNIYWAWYEEISDIRGMEFFSRRVFKTCKEKKREGKDFEEREKTKRWWNVSMHTSFFLSTFLSFFPTFFLSFFLSFFLFFFLPFLLTFLPTFLLPFLPP